MSTAARNRGTVPESEYAHVIKRLRERQSEIETAILSRVRAVSAMVGSEDTDYQTGLHAAVEAVVDYSLTSLEQGQEQEPIPSPAIEQAHRAARLGISVDVIVLRYIAGHRLLGTFVMDEADHCGLLGHGPTQRRLRSVQEALLERLTSVIVHEHRQERERLAHTSEQRHREIVRALLASEPSDISELDYELEAWHIGIIAVGAKAEKAVQCLAYRLGHQLLSVPCGDALIWTWLGSRRQHSIKDVERHIPKACAAGVSLAIGEPRWGLEGWRLTHHEAQAALLVARRKPQTMTRCADVPLEAAMLRTEAAAKSLAAAYLSPLDNLRIGGHAARETLRHYFRCERNLSSTAHSLGVRSRHTIENRLREIEKALGRPIHTCLAELEVALRLEDLGGVP
jgi:hypothetical protein